MDDVETNKKTKWETLLSGCAGTKVWREAAAVCSFCLQPVNAEQIILSPEIRSHGFALFDTLEVKSKHPFGRQVSWSEPIPARLSFPQTCSRRLVLTAVQPRTEKRNIWMWFRGLIVSTIKKRKRKACRIWWFEQVMSTDFEILRPQWKFTGRHDFYRFLRLCPRTFSLRTSNRDLCFLTPLSESFLF